jgi:hypothetical protein
MFFYRVDMGLWPIEGDEKPARYSSRTKKKHLLVSGGRETQDHRLRKYRTHKPYRANTYRATRHVTIDAHRTLLAVTRIQSYISMTLKLGTDHVVPWIRERRLHFLHRRQPRLHRVQPIDALFRKRIELRGPTNRNICMYELLAETKVSRSQV